MMFLATRKIWKCRSCRKQFSVKVGTIFEDSPLPLGKWLTATWLISNCKNGVSSYEIARDIQVTQKSAWFMLQRIRKAMQEEKGGMLGGEVEVDETFNGGKARNMHRA
jgi:transposase-like protein